MAQLSDDPARASRAAERICGPCSACCTVLRVDELAKPAGRDCVHQRGEAGCSIHARRPPVCRGYHCLWLQGGRDDDARPDRTGGIVDLEPDGLGVRLTIRETRPGAFDASPTLQSIADHYRAQMPVRILGAGGFDDPDRPYRVLLADDVEHRIEGERTEVFRAGEHVESRRLPWAERLARRIGIAWRRRRLARLERAGNGL